MISVNRAYNFDDEYDDIFRPAEILERSIKNKPIAFKLMKQLIIAVTKRGLSFESPQVQDLIGALENVIGVRFDNYNVKEMISEVVKFYLSREKLFNFFSRRDVPDIHYEEAYPLIKSEVIDICRIADCVLNLNYNKIVESFDKDREVFTARNVNSTIPGFEYINEQDRQVNYLTHNAENLFAVVFEGNAKAVTVIFGTKTRALIEDMEAGSNKYMTVTMSYPEFAATAFYMACITKTIDNEMSLLENVEIASYHGYDLVDDKGDVLHHDKVSEYILEGKKDKLAEEIERFSDIKYTEQIIKITASSVFARAVLPDVDLLTTDEGKYMVSELPCAMIHPAFFEVTDVSKSSEPGVIGRVFSTALPYLVDIGLTIGGVIGFKSLKLSKFVKATQVKSAVKATKITPKMSKPLLEHKQNAIMVKRGDITALSRVKNTNIKTKTNKTSRKIEDAEWSYVTTNPNEFKTYSQKQKFFDWIKSRCFNKKTIIATSASLAGVTGAATAVNMLIDGEDKVETNFTSTDKKTASYNRYKYDKTDLFYLGNTIADKFGITFTEKDNKMLLEAIIDERAS